jgi:hypothetical protein
MGGLFGGLVEYFGGGAPNLCESHLFGHDGLARVYFFPCFIRRYLQYLVVGVIPKGTTARQNCGRLGMRGYSSEDRLNTRALVVLQANVTR